MTSALPWDAAMELGLRRLRWSPRAFWATSPRDLAVAAGLLDAPISTG